MVSQCAQLDTGKISSLISSQTLDIPVAGAHHQQMNTKPSLQQFMTHPNSYIKSTNTMLKQSTFPNSRKRRQRGRPHCEHYNNKIMKLDPAPALDRIIGMLTYDGITTPYFSANEQPRPLQQGLPTPCNCTNERTFWNTIKNPLFYTRGSI